MGEINAGFQHSFYSSEIQNTFSTQPVQKKVPQPAKLNLAQTKPVNAGNQGHTAKNCHPKSFTFVRRVHKQPFFSRQKRWKRKASDKSEKSEQIPSISTFHTGRCLFFQQMIALQKL